ncbi:hypothetical protein ACS0TY_012047 [Phlomoides rotata]
MGFGMILRDEEGEFVAARTIVLVGCVTVDVGEAMGFYEALLWLKDLGIENVIVEGDVKLIVDAINSPTRDANVLAHEFARFSRSYGDSFTWANPQEFVDELPTIACRCNNKS